MWNSIHAEEIHAEQHQNYWISAKVLSPIFESTLSRLLGVESKK